MSVPATYEQALLALAREREDLVVMTAENRAHIRGLPEALGPRFIDVGICEQTMVGAAAGLALRGRRPVVHALATFLTLRSFEFIRTDVGIPRLPVNQVLLNNRTLVGIDWGAWTMRDPGGNQALLGELMDLAGSGALHPVEPHEYPLDEVVRALTDLQARRVAGKVVLIP